MEIILKNFWSYLNLLFFLEIYLSNLILNEKMKNIIFHKFKISFLLFSIISLLILWKESLFIIINVNEKITKNIFLIEKYFIKFNYKKISFCFKRDFLNDRIVKLKKTRKQDLG